MSLGDAGLLGGSLRSLCQVLGGPWSVLGVSGRALGAFGDPWRVLGVALEVLGLSLWGHQGTHESLPELSRGSSSKQLAKEATYAAKAEWQLIYSPRAG